MEEEESKQVWQLVRVWLDRWDVDIQLLECLYFGDAVFLLKFFEDRKNVVANRHHWACTRAGETIWDSIDRRGRLLHVFPGAQVQLGETAKNIDTWVEHRAVKGLDVFFGTPRHFHLDFFEVFARIVHNFYWNIQPVPKILNIIIFLLSSQENMNY